MMSLQTLIEREIYTLANSTVETLQAGNEYWYEEAENLHRTLCAECEEEIDPDDLPENEEGDDCCPHCRGIYPRVETEPVEVMQWFIVSDWLAGHLRAQGEVVWQPHDVAFWGRQGCGYSLTEEPCLKAITGGNAA